MKTTHESSELRAILLALSGRGVPLEWTGDGWRAFINERWIAVEEQHGPEIQTHLSDSGDDAHAVVSG